MLTIPAQNVDAVSDVGLEALLAEISSEPLKLGLNHWAALRGNRRMPCRADFDPLDVPTLLSYISIVEVRRDPLDFSIRLVGNHIAERLKATVGQTLSELDSEPDADKVWARFATCMETGQPVLGSFGFDRHAGHERRAEALSLPYSNDGELVDFIISYISDIGFYTKK